MMPDISRELHDELVEVARTAQGMEPVGGWGDTYEWLIEAASQWAKSLATAWAPIFKQVMLAVTPFVIALQREVLYQSLPSWMPDRLARLIARYCPVRWLLDLTPERLGHITRSARLDEG